MARRGKLVDAYVELLVKDSLHVRDVVLQLLDPLVSLPAGKGKKGAEMGPDERRG